MGEPTYDMSPVVTTDIPAAGQTSVAYAERAMREEKHDISIH
jgi:hypothetical protein